MTADTEAWIPNHGPSGSHCGSLMKHVGKGQQP